MTDNELRAAIEREQGNRATTRAVNGWPELTCAEALQERDEIAAGLVRQEAESVIRSALPGLLVETDDSYDGLEEDLRLDDVDADELE